MGFQRVLLFFLAIFNSEPLYTDLITGGSVLLASLLAYFLYRARTKQKLLIQQRQALEQQVAQLQQNAQAQDKLFSEISHDLRSPVARLKNKFTLLKWQPDYPKELDSLEWEVNELYLLVDNILYRSLSQRDKLPFLPRPVNLPELIDDILEEFTTLIQHKKWVVRFDRQLVTRLLDETQTLLVLRNVMHYLLLSAPAERNLVISLLKSPAQIALLVTASGSKAKPNGPPAKPENHDLNSHPDLVLAQELMKRNGGELSLEQTITGDSVVTLSWRTTSITS